MDERQKEWMEAKDVQVVALREALLDMLKAEHIHPIVASLAMTEAITLLLNNCPPRLVPIVAGLRELLVLVLQKKSGEALELAELWKAKLEREES